MFRSSGRDVQKTPSTVWPSGNHAWPSFFLLVSRCRSSRCIPRPTRTSSAAKSGNKTSPHSHKFSGFGGRTVNPLTICGAAAAMSSVGDFSMSRGASNAVVLQFTMGTSNGGSRRHDPLPGQALVMVNPKADDVRLLPAAVLDLRSDVLLKNEADIIWNLSPSPRARRRGKRWWRARRRLSAQSKPCGRAWPASRPARLLLPWLLGAASARRSSTAR